MMDQSAERAAVSAALTTEQTFPGEGAMATQMRAMNWAETPLGPVERWPQSLRTAVSICLDSRFPILVWWGPELVMLYNDAYSPIIGAKHPASLGAPGRQVFPEVWRIIGPMLEGVLRESKATWSDDQFLPLERSGYPEECYFTFSYSPIRDESGGVGGVFCAVTETTPRVLGERRTRAARDLAAAIVDARDADEVCARATAALASAAADLPFAVLYLIEGERRQARLASSMGVDAAQVDERAREALAPLLVPVAAGEESPRRQGVALAVARAARTGRREVVALRAPGEEGAMWLGAAREEGAPALQSAVVLPITEPGLSAPSAVLVAGVSPWHTHDDDYEGFYELLASHLSAGLASAHAYEAERKRAEALAVIDRAKTTFFSNVSHEFRTPLSLMLGPLDDVLADGAALPPDTRAQLEMARRNGWRLLRLVNTLLDFARIEAGRVQAVYEPTDVAAFTRDLASAFRSLIEKAGMELIVDCPSLTGMTDAVFVDREMWEKIVLNLISNAFKHTFAGAITVTLRAVDGGAQVELAVRDTGTGIPASQLPHLFERFYRMEGARARTHEGSGIGLALVQELVHLHGGTIHAESREETGTTFFVRLPVGKAHLPADRVRPHQAPAAHTETALGATAFVEEAERWLPDSVTREERSGALDGVSGAALPVALDDALSGAPPQARPAAQAGAMAVNMEPARILLADDNADMRDYLRRLLSERYTVEAVANGAEALAAIQRDPQRLPDLVLADVMMPELDGFGLLRALRADPQTAGMPVILLSARAGEEATIEGLQAGADDYLVKPFSAREALTRVAARLEIAWTRAEAERRVHEALDALMELTDDLVRVPPPAPAHPATTEAVAAGEVTSSAGSDTRALIGMRLVTLIRRVFACDMAAMVTLDVSAGAMQPVAVTGLDPAMEEHWRRDVADMPLQAFLGADVIAQLYAGQAVALDLETTPLGTGADYGMRRILTTPMLLGERVTGLISVEHQRTPRSYVPDDLAVMLTMGRMSALALERDRLVHDQAAAEARELALIETNRRMDEFLGIASHEMRSPLTGIVANLQLAQRRMKRVRAACASAAGGAPLADQLDALGAVLASAERQANRQNRLVSDLLDTARINSGRLELRFARCDLASIVRDAVGDQRSVWPGRMVTLKAPEEGRAPLLVMADADRIGQVVTNYLTNALKYSPSERPVHVRLSVEGDTPRVARVSVSDHGPGLPPEQQALVWERFHRAPGVEVVSGSGVGLGLGLHICREIIERHGGAVGVESEVGRGSTFWFTLPLCADQA
jgi:signal transduction histidine kinase/DNA-binding NarL/FixJ family response regulator